MALETHNGKPAAWVLHYSHRHGDDISLYASFELAAEAIAGIAREYWHEVTGYADGVPATPEGLSDEEAVSVYFDSNDSEGYSIECAEIQGA